jgi:hypothetical protein
MRRTIRPPEVIAAVLAAGLSPWIYTQIGVPVFKLLAEVLP